MNITLELIRHILREALGFDSFTASFIKSVKQDKDIPSAGIAKDGSLAYNPGFIKKYITSREELFCLVFHELLHPMFGHFIFRGGIIENIAADAIINAVISTLYPSQSGGGRLFRKTHEPKGLHGIMRPGSKMYKSRYNLVYERLYGNRYSGKGRMSTGELINTLKILTPMEQCKTVMLLGSHGEVGSGNNGHAGLSGLDEETLARIAGDIRKSAQEKGKYAGFSLNLVDFLSEALRTHLSIRRLLLQKFTTKRKVDRFKEFFSKPRICSSPIPLHPSKRDIVVMAAGGFPLRFHSRNSHVSERNRGLAIYLDVSGSVNEYLPKIIGILRNLRKEITSVFQFSNKVVETRFESLLKGKISTTYGTDFDCIAESIIENGFSKAVVITDGYASMEDDLKEELRKRHVSTLTVLFDDAQKCDDFGEFGDVVQLEDVCA